MSCRSWTSPPATSSGRSHLLPKSGSRAPWRLKQNYLFDMRMIRHGKVDEEALHVHQTPCARGGLGLDASVCGDDDDTVVVAVGDLARHEHHATELDGDIALAVAGLGALAGVGAQRLDADVEGAQRRPRPAPRR